MPTMNTKKQRATLPAPSFEASRPAENLHGEKETIETKVLVAFDARKGKPEHGYEARFANVVDVRWYMSRSKEASVVYCSVWIRTRNTTGQGVHLSGRGTAGGYGYCKKSAAFQDAISAAGIRLSRHIGGAGMSAVEEAMQAIASACGYIQTPKTII